MASHFRFGRFDLEPAVRELRADGEAVHLEQQVFDVLVHLVRHRDRVVTREELLDEVWGDRFVSDSALSSRIKSARQAVDDDGDRQGAIRTIRGVGFRFVAEVTEVVGADDRSAVADPDDRSAVADPDDAVDDPVAGTATADLEPRIHFVPVRGDRSLAVGQTGTGPCLIKTATWLTKVDSDDGTNPIWGHWVRALSRRFHYVRYDPRGCGLSDRDLDGQDLTDLDLWVDDLHRIVESVGRQPVALLGVSQGGPVAIAYAARYPERVSHLVLYGTYALGMNRRGDQAQAEQASLQVDLARTAWATDSALFREVFARMFVPGAQLEEIDWFNEQLRVTTTADSAPLLEQAFHDLDVSDLARSLRVPTLVLHADDDRAVPFVEGRRVAGLIPGARLVPLRSRNHILLQRDAAFTRFVDEVATFIGDAAPGGR
ncbi:MAG: alpha/beta fold hydrolase [Actinomycetota bacterium]